MPEFAFELPGVNVIGVCATDATDETIRGAVAADLAGGAPVGSERRLEAAQIVYTAEPVHPAQLDLTDAQRAALPALAADAVDDPAAYIAVKSELPPETGPIGPATPAG